MLFLTLGELTLHSDYTQYNCTSLLFVALVICPLLGDYMQTAQLCPSVVVSILTIMETNLTTKPFTISLT